MAAQRMVQTINLVICLLLVSWASFSQSVRHFDKEQPNLLPTGVGSTTFTLIDSATTAAEVYDKKGNSVRTLWSSVKYSSAGTYPFPVQWNGCDDYGKPLLDGNYDIKVQASNMKADWEGVIGNTSANDTGVTVHLGYDFISTLCISGNRLYYGTGYSELSSSQAAFDLNNIQVKIPIGAERTTNQSSYYNATDGVNVYWAGVDYSNAANRLSFIYASSISDNSKVAFANGTSYTTKGFPAITYSAVGMLNGSNYFINGLAVNSKFIFVSRADNNIYIYDKTGLFVRKIAFASPKALCIGANDSDLWVVSGADGANVCARYTVNSNGTLTATGSRITTIFSIGAIAANKNLIMLCDVSIRSQQVKAFNIKTLAPLWALGRSGGYSTSEVVYNDKFYWADNIFNYPTSLAIQNDGSFWVLDYGNSRLLKFDKNRTYVDYISYLGRFYDATIDLNNPTIAFASFKEYSIDYKKPLHQSWKLINNWSFHVLPMNVQRRSEIGRVTTLSNGKRYMTCKENNAIRIYELRPNYGLRNTGRTLVNTGYTLFADGSYTTIINKGTSAAQNYIVTKYNLKGFDAANNPLYDNGIVIGSTGVISFNDVQPIPFLYSRCQGIITKSGKIIMYGAYPIVVNNQPVQSGYNQGYHLGAIKLGATGFTWQTRKATYTNYQGDYPTDGSFDVGNGVRYNAGSGVIVLDSILFTQEHNEFWKQTQTNIWNVYSEKGLFIGQFGIAKPRNEVLSPNTVAPYGMSGNGFALSGVKLGNDYYLYNNDESFHGGLHRWKVNISTSTQTIPVTLNRVQKGLCAYYFKDSDLNIANYIASQIDTLLEFKGKGSIPVNGFNSDKYSVRWQGFLQAKFSEPYTLGVRTSGNVRLYFDDTLRIGDTAVTLRDVFFKTPVLQAGKLYSIKAEFANNPSVNAYAQLYWQSASQNRQAIPFHYLTPNSDSVLYSEPSKGIDLLADLPFNTEMTAGYGWTRTGTASNLWTAITNRYNYKKPDLYLSYSLGSNVELRKDLGISEDVNAWNLSLTIDMFRSGYSNSPGTGKLALEIMDSSNKRLARIEPITTQSSGTTYQEVKTNETNVFSMPYNLIDKTTNIVLAYSSGNFTIQVNNSTIYKLNSLDAGGNIAFPKYLRFVGLNATGEKDIAPKAFYLSKAIFQYQNYHLTLRKH